MKFKSLTTGNYRKSFDLLSLLSGKIGNILVGVFFLPLYAKYLQADIFSAVTIIISLQALATMLDFGMAIVVARETAIQYQDNTKLLKHSILKDAENILSLAYLFLTAVALILNYFTSNVFTRLDEGDILMAIAIIYLTVLQNVYFNVLLAARIFVASSWLQIILNLVRGIASYAAVVSYPDNIKPFLITQLVILLIHTAAFRFICFKKIYSNLCGSSKKSLGVLLQHGKKLALYSIAGACVLQLDKIIIAHQHKAEISAPYFLASTFCMLPITVLATPIMQFFQPKIVKHLHMDNGALSKILTRFNFAVCGLVLLPTICLWIIIPFVIRLWLHHGAYVNDVIHYSTILLPGIAIGALGYVPFVLLIGMGDFKFQAITSFILTTITLVCVYIFSLQGSIVLVCWAYFLYHSASTIIFWTRCATLNLIRADSLRNIKFTSVCILLMFCFLYVVHIFRNL